MLMSAAKTGSGNARMVRMASFEFLMRSLLMAMSETELLRVAPARSIAAEFQRGLNFGRGHVADLNPELAVC